MGMNLKVGDWEFCCDSNELERGDERIRLESRCTLVLQYLCDHAGQVVTHNDLLDAVWGREAVSVQSVPVVISKLRALLGDDTRQPRYIETIPKRGYRLIAEVDQSGGGSQSRVDPPGRDRAFKTVLRLASGALLIFGILFALSSLKLSAVLPRILYVADVANLTNDGAMNSFAAGASEILSSELARAGGLSVVRLRRGRGDSQWVAPGLSDDGTRPTPLLTTSLVLADQGAKIMMQLEDSPDRSVVWTYDFDISGNTYAALQREAARELLEYYGIAYVIDAGIYTSGTLGVEEIYLRAKYHWGLRGRDNNMLAARLAGQALELDPDYVPAHALSAQIYGKYAGEYFNLDSVDTEALARQHLDRAISLDPDHPAVFVARAQLHILLDRRPDLALAATDRAIELRPSEGIAHRLRSMTLNQLGRNDDGLAAMDRALELELGSPYVKAEYLYGLYLGARFEEVTRLAESLDPEYLGTFRAMVAESYYQLGRHRAAMQTWLDLLAFYGFEIGNREELLRLVDHGDTRNAYRALSAYVEPMPALEGAMKQNLLLFWSVYFGDEEASLAILRSISIDRENRFLNLIHMWPLFNRFQGNPVFQEFLTRIGVAQYADCVHLACAGH